MFIIWFKELIIKLLNKEFDLGKYRVKSAMRFFNVKIKIVKTNTWYQVIGKSEH